MADLKFEVMRAKLGEARAKKLQQEAIEELNSIKKETGAIPQTFSATVEEPVIITTHPQSTRQLPENRPTISTERYLTNVPGKYPQKLTASEPPLRGVTTADPLSFVAPVFNNGSTVHISIPGTTGEKAVRMPVPQMSSSRRGSRRGGGPQFASSNHSRGSKASNSAALPVYSNAAFTNPPAPSQTSTSGLSSPSSQMTGPFAPYPDFRTFGNRGTSNFSFGSGSSTFSHQLSSPIASFPSYPDWRG